MWTCKLSLRPFPEGRDGLKGKKGASQNVLQLLIYCAARGSPQLRMRILVAAVLAIAAPVKGDTNTYTNSQPRLKTLNTPENRQSWGSFDINTNYYEVTPDTGRTVEVESLRNFLINSTS